MTSYKQDRKPNTGITYTGGWCLSAVQTAYGTDHKYPTAAAWWSAEPHKHNGTPPKGIEVPIFLTIAGVPAGHVAIWLGDGRVASASQPGTHSGLYIHESIAALIQYYSSVYKLTYVGWGETVGSVRVVEPVAAPKPAPKSTGRIAAKGTATVTVSVLNVRTSPNTSAKIVATYKKGQKINYDSYQIADGYVWLSYVGTGGARHYVAEGPYDNNPNNVYVSGGVG
jgi:hypothetical protein